MSHEPGRYEGPEHLAAIRVKQYALIAHLEGASVYQETLRLIANGPVKSRCAVFMLQLIDDALREETEDAP